MARGVNKVILIGHLGADPEIRYTPSNMAIASVRLATTERRKDGQSGEWKESTEWHRLVMFGRTAEVAGEYLRKGSQIYVEGRLSTNKWQDKQGNDRYTTEVIVNDMQMLGARGGSGGGSASFDEGPSYSGARSGGGGDYPGGSGASSPAAGSGSSSSSSSGSGFDDDFDDDIPF